MPNVREPKIEEEVQIPQDWFDRVEEAARQYNLPIPETTADPEETERNLRNFEQDGGQ